MEINFEFLRHQLIGQDEFFSTPYGKRLITYADYTASGKTLGFIEKYMIDIQKVYANTHTDDSYTGKTMTNLLHKAEQTIKACVGADERHHIISVGTGSTGAITRLCKILGLYLTPGLKYNINQHLNNNTRYNDDIIKDMFEKMSDSKPVVFVSPYEHHSNYLIWIESFAEVVEINLSEDGTFDYQDLEDKLNYSKYTNRVKIGSFSAASNITGLKSDVNKLAKMMHNHDGIVFFDYAASAPYVEINMSPQDPKEAPDAIFISPHKFLGGPGSSGILIFNKELYNNVFPPTVAAGGTVDFVSPYCYEFMKDIEAREKAGTPGILQTIKSSLAFELKEAIGSEKIEEIEHQYILKVINRLKKHKNIEILGPLDPNKRIAILSFNIKHNNKRLHHKLVTTLLNDLFGIQSRAGCACAGPYGHRLLTISKNQSMIIKEATNEGIHSLKPGFVRVNFHYLIPEFELDFICKAIEFIATYGYLFLSKYAIDLKSGSWKYIKSKEQTNDLVDQFGIHRCISGFKKDVFKTSKLERKALFNYYLNHANEQANKLSPSFNPTYRRFKKLSYESCRWFDFIHMN